MRVNDIYALKVVSNNNTANSVVTVSNWKHKTSTFPESAQVQNLGVFGRKLHHLYA